MITKNFKTLCENHIRRYQSNGFLAGDYIRLKPNALNHPELKDKAENYVKLIQSMQNSDLNLKISTLKTDRPSNSGLIGGADSPTKFYADVITELNPGGWSNPVTLPIEVLVLQNDGTTYPPIPDSLIRKNPENKIHQADEFMRTKDDTLKGEPLTRQNIKLAHSPDYDDTKFSGGKSPIKKESIDTHENKSISNLYVEDVFNKVEIPLVESVQSILPVKSAISKESKVVTSDLSNVYEKYIQGNEVNTK